MTQKYFAHDATPALRRYAIRLTRDAGRADDLVQDTWTCVLARKRKCEIENPQGYMLSVMHNLFIDGMRKHRPKPDQVPLDEVELPSPEASAGLRLTCAEIMGTIDKLPKVYGDVLIRHACQGQSYEEIATSLGIPQGTVMSRIARARQKLCAILNLDQSTGLWDDL